MKKIIQLPRKALEMLAIEFGYGDPNDKEAQKLLIKTATRYQLADYISRSI